MVHLMETFLQHFRQKDVVYGTETKLFTVVVFSVIKFTVFNSATLCLTV